MSAAASRVYTIETSTTTRQILDLLTRKRWYAVLTTRQEISERQKDELRNEGLVWIEICGTEEGKTQNHPGQRRRFPVWRHLVLGEPLDSRSFIYEKWETEYGWPSAFPPIRNLYKYCEGRTLRFDISAHTEADANRIWLREMLRLGADPGKWYASDDYSSIKIAFQRVAESTEEGDGDESATTPTPIDVAEFDVFDHLRNMFEQRAQDPKVGYGDDVFVEYGIRSDEGVARYCATEFYTNHNWSWDPANLFVVRFCGEVLPGECAPCGVQFSHPSKTTIRKSSRKRYLVDTLTMFNDVKVKFSSGKGREEQHPDTKVSADRIMDNLVDFSAWLDMHRHEIELL